MVLLKKFPRNDEKVFTGHKKSDMNQIRDDMVKMCIEGYRTKASKELPNDNAFLGTAPPLDPYMISDSEGNNDHISLGGVVPIANANITTKEADGQSSTEQDLVGTIAKSNPRCLFGVSGSL